MELFIRRSSYGRANLFYFTVGGRSYEISLETVAAYLPKLGRSMHLQFSYAYADAYRDSVQPQEDVLAFNYDLRLWRDQRAAQWILKHVETCDKDGVSKELSKSLEKYLKRRKEERRYGDEWRTMKELLQMFLSVSKLLGHHAFGSHNSLFKELSGFYIRNSRQLIRHMPLKMSLDYIYALEKLGDVTEAAKWFVVDLPREQKERLCRRGRDYRRTRLGHKLSSRTMNILQTLASANQSSPYPTYYEPAIFPPGVGHCVGNLPVATYRQRPYNLERGPRWGADIDPEELHEIVEEERERIFVFDDISPYRQHAYHRRLQGHRRELNFESDFDNLSRRRRRLRDDSSDDDDDLAGPHGRRGHRYPSRQTLDDTDVYYGGEGVRYGNRRALDDLDDGCQGWGYPQSRYPMGAIEPPRGPWMRGGVARI
ncbi:MAG: hypothetical protein M1819_007466 [Sarea resinae]|nr:MAG: hypothetical protein M1819_007466 [Sarea resinae]